MIGASESVLEQEDGELRLAIADARAVVAHALGALLATFEGLSVAFVAGGRTALPLMSTPEPDILIVGVGAEVEEALELAQMLRERAPAALVVLLADALDSALVRFSLDQRVDGLLLSGISARDLVAALHQVARGQVVLPSGWQGVLGAEAHGPLDELSKRQIEVLRLVALGVSYEEIGARLFISVNTVKFHVRSIYVRLGVNNRMAAARLLAEGSATAPHN